MAVNIWQALQHMQFRNSDGQCLRASGVAEGYPDNGYLDQDFLRAMPFLMSTQTVYKQATKGHSSMIGQYYSDYNKKQKCSQYQILVLHIHHSYEDICL